MAGKFDPIFGQSKAFSTDDPNVNPDVIKYLNQVRNEALSTSAVSMSSVRMPERMSSPVVRHEASMYDDDDNEEGSTQRKKKKMTIKDEKTSNIPEEFVNFRKRLDISSHWFDDLKKELQSQPSRLDHHYDDESLNLLISSIKKNVSTRINKSEDESDQPSGIILHLNNLLKDWEMINNLSQEDFIVDDEWIQNLIIQLQCVKIPNLTTLKDVIKGDYSNLEPRGFKLWDQFVRFNEPCNDMFKTMINDNNIWLLVKYMATRWVNSMIQGQNQYSLMLWLIYLLLNLPLKVTANNTSTLRDLGKECKKVILTHYQNNEITDKDTDKDKLLSLMIIPSDLKFEFKQFTPQEPVPSDTSLIELTLYLIATKYGQLDLIEWE